MKRKLPIGIQDFVKIREEGFCYVDKTARIYELLTGSGGTFFLSRPRRFGKSLLCSTLAAIFDGRRELFGALGGQPALAINRLEWEWTKYPVIRLDLNPGLYEDGPAALTATIENVLRNAASGAGLSPRGETLPVQFGNLIQDMYDHSGQKAVVLIDEYDKPLLSTIDNRELHQNMRAILKGFYAVLKSSDQYLKFVFLTGVSKFSRVSVFSELNNLIDLSLDGRYADLCGITQEELERDFAGEIGEIARERGTDRETYLERLRRYYNGYRFSRNPLTVYNPYGLLNHFYQDGDFRPYWFETATPSFLIKLIEEQRINILELNGKTVRYEDFRKYDADNMHAVPVLYQTGYLTISGYDEEQDSFVLDYPNEEVRASFADSLIDICLHIPAGCHSSLAVTLMDTLLKGDVEGAINALKPFFASIPYDLTANNENFYQTAIHLIFTMLGLRCRSEVRIAAGRIDTLVETGKYLYCFEFKVSGPEGSAAAAEEALRQIDRKEYLLPWQGSGKQLVKAGVAFDTEKRNIGEYRIGHVM
jgi:hypothetical protein